MLNLFVSGVAMAALQTLTATTNSRSFAGGTRIDDLIVLIAAFWTAHTFRQPLHNVVFTFRNNKGLWRQAVFCRYFWGILERFSERFDPTISPRRRTRASDRPTETWTMAASTKSVRFAHPGFPHK